MRGKVFEKFVAKSPISVMVRAALERVLGADRLDLWFELGRPNRPPDIAHFLGLHIGVGNPVILSI